MGIGAGNGSRGLGAEVGAIVAEEAKAGGLRPWRSRTTRSICLVPWFYFLGKIKSRQGIQ